MGALEEEWMRLTANGLDWSHAPVAGKIMPGQPARSQCAEILSPVASCSIQQTLRAATASFSQLHLSHPSELKQF